MKKSEHSKTEKKLVHITFTGVDEMTDIGEMKRIQEKYPYVEFGVLFSKNWQHNGNRYINPTYMGTLRKSGLRLSCHACGSVARDALRGNWLPLEQLTNGMYVFKRCQLNVSKADIKDEIIETSIPVGLDEVIIQQESPDNMSIWNRIHDHGSMSILFDASGGKGIDSEFRTLSVEGTKIGYAGGITPENVAGKLTSLFEDENVGEFWIDMESGVRTDDWFDLKKVMDVIEACEPIIKKYNGKRKQSKKKEK